jgi:DNA-binding Lrp family transcriptional regulator
MRSVKVRRDHVDTARQCCAFRVAARGADGGGAPASRSALTSVGAALAAHPEPDVVAATTGPTNLMAGVTCRDTQDLYRYLTERVAPLDGVRELETVLVIRTVKRVGTAPS